MIHPLSRATSYLQTFAFNQTTGEQVLRSHATGFFVRLRNALLLVTNWHVVTGLDPASPSGAGRPTPQLLKATLMGKRGFLTELSLPLYDKSNQPLWCEHPTGPKVDLAIYPLPLDLEEHFYFVDIHSVEDEAEISEAVAKDVFILGYPFSRDELKAGFGDDAPYFLPVWKRGSIATEPGARLGNGILLIDSLSRAGMSGSPVVIAQDEKLLVADNEANAAVLQRLKAGETGAFKDLALDALTEKVVKHYRFLGVYSGTIGSTRLAETALGKCWHADTLLDLIENHRDGVMPFHAPEPNVHYNRFLAQTAGGALVLKDINGEVTKRDLIGTAVTTTFSSTTVNIKAPTG